MSNAPLPPAPPGYMYVSGPDGTLYLKGPEGKLYYPQSVPAAAPTSPHPARMTMPDTPDLGGDRPGVPAWVPKPFYPTHPFQSTNPTTGHQTRYYGATLVSTDADYAAGTETARNVVFDIPCRIIAINGWAFNTSADEGNALPLGVDGLSCWLFRAEYSQGDRLNVRAGIAKTCVGTGERPGQIGGYGWTVRNGTVLRLGLTPLLANLRIDVTVVCLELRGNTNHT